MGLLARPRARLAQALTRAGQSVAPAGLSVGLHAAAYRAGRTDPQWVGDWLFGAQSMTRILRADLPALRDKSRDVTMNNATAAALPRIFSSNVSGKDGILYQARVEVDGEPDVATNAMLEAAWYRWAEDPRAVTCDGRLTWQEVEALTDESECVDGETLVRLLPGFRNAWGFALQLLDPDQLDIGYTEEIGPTGRAIIMGVEVDEWGAPVAYHLWPNHPSDVRRRGERMRVPAAQILHTFMPLRAGQFRGVPWLAPVLDILMQLGKYREAEVVAARVSAAKMGFIRGGTGDGEEIAEATPGAMIRLGLDEEFQAFDPNHPNGNFAAFERTALHAIAASQRVSYMTMSGDLSQTSFSSGRMGYLGETAYFRRLQQRRILRYSRPVHAAWLDMAILSGQVELTQTRAAMLRSDWRPRSFAPIDELKDAKTRALNVAMGLQSLTDLVEEDGRDLREVLLKRRAEMELARELGVPLYLPASGNPVGHESGESDGFGRPPADEDRERERADLHLTRVA